MTDLRLLLQEFVPQIIIVDDCFESRRQTKTVSMRREQFHAEGMNRSEKRAAERFHGLQRQSGFEDSLSRSLLHFIGSPIRVGNDDELRKPFERTLWTSRDLDDPIGDRVCFARARRGDHREIAVQFASKSLPLCFVGNGRHFISPSS
jgi:hypothetical protein